jgi:hypothetical protein
VHLMILLYISVPHPSQPQTRLNVHGDHSHTSTYT